MSNSIDWGKPLECVKGTIVSCCVYRGTSIEVVLGADTQAVRYFVDQETGEPESDHLIDRKFIVGNKKTKRYKAIELFNSMPAKSRLTAGEVFIDQLIEAGIFEDD